MTVTSQGVDAWLVDTEVNRFGRHEGHGLVDCASGVLAELLSRHPALESVDSLWVGSARPGESEGWESGLGVAVARATGLAGVPATDVHAFCASSNVAFIHASDEIRSGRADVSLVVGVEHMSTYARRGPLRPPALPEWAAEMSPPVFYALCASRYLADHDLGPEVLADIAVRNRARAVDNPHAAFQTAVTREEVLGSRMISDPVTLLQCSAPGDGAGAALLVSAAGAARLDLDLTGSPRVAGVGHCSAGDQSRPSLVSFEEDGRAAAAALAMAGLAASQLDVLEVHDAFTVAQAIHLEDIGVAPRGRGWAIGGGEGPLVNPSGGLLGRSHPLGATGMAQLHSVRQALGRSFGGVTTRHAMVQEAGGLQHLGQMLSTAIVLAA